MHADVMSRGFRSARFGAAGLGLALAVLVAMADPARCEDVEAGPIWNNADAGRKCPPVCTRWGGRWDANWRTTVANRMSVWSCETPPTPLETGVGGGGWGITGGADDA